ncbi:hypothetical protein OSH10_02270 [Kaistia defluvii]|uniref:hypothetical protein n=1 Tax=Kaistia defluvii TaxID=410841 RepID=UPI00224CBD0B|nr:hypothetical protein [Kaistia defluvii]MCX5517249.1 hypothetical protein [Kaistia defluvii]
MRWRLIRILFLIYVAWAIFALLLVPLSAFGMVAENPLAAVLGLVLGLPWSVLLTWWIDSSSPIVNFLLLALALAINGGILRYLSRRPRPAPPEEEDDDEEEELDNDEDDPDADLDDDWDEDWDEPEPSRPRRR